MSFFRRHPKFWIAIWTLFGFGGLLMAFNATFDHGVDASQLVKGVIAVAVAGVMVSYLLPQVRKTDAQD